MKPLFALLVTFCALLLVACAADKIELAPDSAANAQLKPAYMVGDWCTNRDLTAQHNKDLGFSPLSNLSKVFWRFRASGKWEDSPSGWMYAHYGKWRLEGLNTMILDRLQGAPVRYSANFKASGNDLYLQDDSGSFLILSRCS